MKLPLQIYTDRWKVECLFCETLNRPTDKEVNTQIMTCGCCKQKTKILTPGALAIEACKEVMDAVIANSKWWHPAPDIDTQDWNDDAHVDVTLTIKDCRMLKRVLQAAGKANWDVKLEP